VGKQDDKDAKWPGFPERLREAFQRAGYWKNDRPDVMRFVPERGMQHGIHVSYCYKYVNGETVPDRKILVALATELGVQPWWLLFGDEAMVGKGDNPRGKAPRRQGRRTAGSLVLAFAVGTAAALLPSGAWAGEAQSALYITPILGLTTCIYWLYAVSIRRRCAASWLGNCTLSLRAA
jgi:hypothetical protein